MRHGLLVVVEVVVVEVVVVRRCVSVQAPRAVPAIPHHSVRPGEGRMVLLARFQRRRRQRRRGVVEFDLAWHRSREGEAARSAREVEGS
jgi:hypothetical protein